MPTTPVTRLYNGTVVKFATVPLARIVGLSYRLGGEWVEVTVPEDANKLFEMGKGTYELQLKYKGKAPTAASGDKGAVVIEWSDGDTLTCPGTWQIGKITKDGNYDAGFDGTIELRPTVPDA